MAVTRTMGHQITISVGPALQLTELRAEDRATCVALLDDRQIFERTLRIPFPYTPADFDAFLAVAEAAVKTHGHPIHFAIRDADQRLLGGCGFDGLTKGHSAELGYWLGRSYWSHGIMTEVVRSVTAMAHREWQLVRISAHVFDSNHASMRVLEKAGFHHEGSLAKYYCKQGTFIDAELYASVMGRDFNECEPRGRAPG